MIIANDIVRPDIREWYIQNNPQPRSSIPPPTILQLEVTKNCNYECIMCHKGQSILSGKDFLRDDLSDIARKQIKPIFPFLRKAILFGDGEPMVYRYFWEIVEEIRTISPQCAIDFINNGSLMHKKNRDKLFEYKVSHLGLSLGGAKPESHNFARPPGLFNEIIDNYRNLYIEKQSKHTLEPYVTVLMVVMQCNYQEIPELVELCHHIGVVSLHLQKLFVTGSNVESQIVSDEQLEPYLTKGSALAKTLGVGLVHHPLASGKNYHVKQIKFNPTDLIFQPHYDKNPLNHGYCKNQEPWNTVYVLHDGKVVPDCHWWASQNEKELNTCGVLDEKTDILDIWNGVNYQTIRQRIESGDILPQCRGCGLAGGVVDKFRGIKTDHTDPEQETRLVQINVTTQTKSIAQPDKREIKNALVIGIGNNRWINAFTKEITNIGIKVIAFIWKNLEPIDNVVSIYVEIENKWEPGYKHFETVLIEHNIDIIFLHASFTIHVTKLCEFVLHRNYFIEQGVIKGKMIDLFFYESGFLRPWLRQLDNCGWNFLHSSSEKNIIPLNKRQNQYLDSWLFDFTNYRCHHSLNKSNNWVECQPVTRQGIIKMFNLPPNKKIIFCPLQKPGDSVLQFATRWCSTIPEFIEMCLKIFKTDQYVLIFKQHPLDNSDSILYSLIQQCGTSAVFIHRNEMKLSTGSLIAAADAVCTVNSSVGCEAMAFDKPVICFGYAVYSKQVFQCYHFDENTLKNITAYIDNFYATSRDKQRAFLYDIIDSSFSSGNYEGRSNTLKELINKKSRFGVI